MLTVDVQTLVTSKSSNMHFCFLNYKAKRGPPIHKTCCLSTIPSQASRMIEHSHIIQAQHIRRRTPNKSLDSSAMSHKVTYYTDSNAALLLYFTLQPGLEHSGATFRPDHSCRLYWPFAARPSCDLLFIKLWTIT